MVLALMQYQLLLIAGKVWITCLNCLNIVNIIWLTIAVKLT